MPLPVMPSSLVGIARFPRARLGHAPTPIDPAPNLGAALGIDLWIKRDDCTGLAFGGNKVRQIEFHFGEAEAQGADTVLVTGAVQSNLVRIAAAAARRLGMEAHIQLEDRVADGGETYRTSGNLLLDRVLGATLHPFPEGEDEAAADATMERRAAVLAAEGRRPYLTRPAAELGLLMMGHCTAREAAAFFAKTGAMTPSVSTLRRLTLSMHECWESLGPETLGSIREAEGIPRDATTASVSLDGVMVPLRPGEDGRAKASWREAACGTVSFHDAEGKRLKTLYLGRMPESGKLTLKAQLASEVAHIRRARPEIGIVAIADGAADNWTFLETLSPETEVIDFWHACEHLQTASDHAVAPGWFEKYREILRHDPRGVAKVIRALRHLRDAAAAPDRAETERELAFFRKHRHRMRYHALKEEGIAIGSGVVEAANKTLVTQRMKRSGMRWRIVGGQAVLTFRALIKSGRFERAWKALISATDTPANDNISPRAAAMAIAA